MPDFHTRLNRAFEAMHPSYRLVATERGGTTVVAFETIGQGGTLMGRTEEEMPWLAGPADARASAFAEASVAFANHTLRHDPDAIWSGSDILLRGVFEDSALQSRDDFAAVLSNDTRRREAHARGTFATLAERYDLPAIRPTDAIRLYPTIEIDRTRAEAVAAVNAAATITDPDLRAAVIALLPVWIDEYDPFDGDTTPLLLVAGAAALLHPHVDDATRAHIQRTVDRIPRPISDDELRSAGFALP